jgi:hypothetical protein
MALLAVTCLRTRNIEEHGADLHLAPRLRRLDKDIARVTAWGRARTFSGIPAGPP